MIAHKQLPSRLARPLRQLRARRWVVCDLEDRAVRRAVFAWCTPRPAQLFFAARFRARRGRVIYPREVQLTIEKLIYGGDGLARAADGERRGKAIFVPYVLAGEHIEADIIEERKGFARARMTQIVTPASERRAPRCPHFARCGGCQYQHANYATQLETKRQILAETVLRTAKIELPEIQVHAADEWGFRNRTRLKIATTPQFALGYYCAGSHELEAVHECPISSPLINRAMAALWELGDEAAKYEALHEVQFFANHDDTELLIEFSIHHATAPQTLAPLAQHLRQRLPEIRGVAIFATANAGRGEWEDDDLEAVRRRERAGQPFVEGEGSLSYTVGDTSYRVSAGSFFQTNRFLLDKLIELVVGQHSGRAALDLYAGVGLFTLPLTRTFEKVTAVEIAPSSSIDLALNANGPHVRTFQNTTEEFLQTTRGHWNLVVADPPRAGLGERVTRAITALKTEHLVLVSCDPATLGRDLALLGAAGYRVHEAHLLDLFPQTAHLETVLQLVR